MEIIAKSNNIRISPRKIRLIADEIRHLPLPQAETVLENLNKSASKPLLWVLRQGLANAQNNFGLKSQDLSIKTLEIGKGPMMKRHRFVGRGRIHKILKRTSHITLVLEGEKTEKTTGKKIVKKPVKKTRKKEEKNGTKN
ncbi:MAG: 50S ribosomal protein L22 [Patescibacteria group bacterium]